MGIPVLVLGESGTGKSASMRNFKSDDIALVNVVGKPLPFRGKFDEAINSDSYRQIKKFVKECFAPVAVIDDAQYLLANEFMRRASERGYDKFTEIAVNYWDLVRYVVEKLPADKIVYFLSHIERDQNGNEKIKTIGKLLDEKITVEGMFTIVLKTSVKDGKYSFITQNNGHDTVKSPIGLFPAVEIDNDLKAVTDSIRKYYDSVPGEKHPALDKKTDFDDVEIPEDDKVPFGGFIEDDDPVLPKEETPKEEAPKRVRRTRKER